MAGKELDAITTAIIRFSKYLHDKLKKIDADNLFSPLSVHAFLALLSQDPWCYTKEDINAALGIDVNFDSTHYKNMFDVLTKITDLLIVNASYLKPCQVPEAFRNCLVDDFASEVNYLDFTNLENATAALNAWFRDRTVRRIAPHRGLRDDVNLTSLNATCFKSKWVEPFSTEETVPATFYLDKENTVQVPVMKKKGEFYFDDNSFLGAKILKLPFVSKDVNLLVILPGGHINITNFIQVVRMYVDLKNVTTNLTKRVVNVSLPKFKIEEELELDQYLKELGLEGIFNARLKDLIEDEELTCHGVQQKVYLELNEEGLEVASGTMSILTKAHYEELPPKDGLKVFEANIFSEVVNRFAKTKVVWRVNNTGKMAADANFKVVLTDLAFITAFAMEINDKSYKSYIKEKKEASSIFKKAKALGQSAGLVEIKTRHSKEFTVSVNLEPNSVAIFTLTYEEVLQRVHDQYELVLNICPGQIVDNLSIEVRINESRPLKFVKTPPLRSGNFMNIRKCTFRHLDPLSDIKIVDQKTASIKFRPDAARQRHMADYLGNKKGDGLSGQFVVQYDVEREPLNGEVLLQGGYFVHFFAPDDLNPLPKHVIFVLDTSGSMRGLKFDQLKDALMIILSDLRKEDMLSIIGFNDEVIVWDVNSKQPTTVRENTIRDFKNPFASLKRKILPDPHRISDDIEKPKEIVQAILAGGGTFMIGALETALYLVKMGRQKDKVKDRKLQPIIVFLTDGLPTTGIASTEKIIELVTHLNAKDKVPIFSLSFGDGADKDFLRKLSLQNMGFWRHIYEAADASLQLQDFYKQISYPLLHDIKFKYNKKVAKLTRTHFPIYFRGSELVVAGKCVEETFPTTIDCWGTCGPVTIGSAKERPITSLERFWAYLTVKQLLEERDISSNPKKLTKRALKLALKYSFVTDVTSLVVVKPREGTSSVSSRPESEDKSFAVLLRNQNRCYSSVDSAYRYGHPLPLNYGILVPYSLDSWESVGGCEGPREMPASRRRACSGGGPSSIKRNKCLASLRSYSASTTTSTGGTTYFREMSAPWRRTSSEQGAQLAGNMSVENFGQPTYINQGMEFDSGEKPVEFTADHPFLVFLQVEIDNAVFILFEGCVYRPSV